VGHRKVWVASRKKIPHSSFQYRVGGRHGGVLCCVLKNAYIVTPDCRKKRFILHCAVTMDFPKEKRAKMELKPLEEYNTWLLDNAAEKLNVGGMSARIFSAKGRRIIKEQILGFVDGVWCSLQLYRTDIMGMDAVRDMILRKEPLSKSQKRNTLSLNTHCFLDEVFALQIASEHNITPDLFEYFFVELTPEFRLGVTLQERLFTVFWEWEESYGYSGMLDRIQILGFSDIRKTVDILSKNKLVYFDWNCGNMGVTQTSKFQLIDFACSKRDPIIRLREKSDNDFIRDQMISLWCKAISYRSMYYTWMKFGTECEDFYKNMFIPARREYKVWKERCHDFLVEHAHPETDFQQVLEVDMLNE
jgi:hypothetical protein